GSLSWPELLVLATAAALGADSGAVPLSAVADRLGVDAGGGPLTVPESDDDNDDDSPFLSAVSRLRELALICGEPGHVRIVPVPASAIAAAPVVAPHPGEPTGAELDEAWAGLSAPAVGVLEAIARGRTPVGALGPGPSESVRAAATELAAAGLAEITGGTDTAGTPTAGSSAGGTAGTPTAGSSASAESVVPRAHALDRARHGERPSGSTLLDLPAWAEPAATRAGGAAENADASGGVAALELL